MPFVRTARAGKKLGRKKSKTSGASHQKKAEHDARHPIHATLKLAQGVPGLRNKRTLGVIERAFDQGKERFGFRLVHYSVQGNHMHLIVEAQDRLSLTRGMKGLAVRLARALNAAWRRKGRVFRERFHEHALKTPREVRNALAYVLKNWQRHAKAFTKTLDPFASGRGFDGWSEPFASSTASRRALPVAAAATWLLKVGWRRHGLVPVVRHD